MRTLQPANWARPRGYSNGIEAEGRMIFVAGQIGWDGNGEFREHQLAGQFRQALRNVLAVLKEAGAGPEHIARMTMFVTSREDYVAARPQLGEAWKELMGKNFPAMAVIIVSGFVEPAAKIEIEATAVVPR
ncbi:MAG TPA: RidA family protein [Rhizomicrobium sp.]|jgi:enamine deaminase RidA (YjgF/YER057c/UK114 family)|nr:RidA family protein [Rhizomicrobium sp.]